MVGLLISLLVFLVIIALVYWVITQLALPEPITRIAVVVLVVVAAIVLITFLLNLAGGGYSLSMGPLTGRRLIN